ncbi:unnamed protein product [Soboliphyme baturini]|uniref:C2H2-type domain-containing protein n=1 Tax=Soboliphyme baturini TaxID=241478 RepID=A0A183IP11_9BILA|nr:unnamed protein product [Soboliphyme baturini]
MGEVHHASKAKRRVCDICCHAANTFCIGECNHPICFVCGTRIRVVCENSEYTVSISRTRLKFMPLRSCWQTCANTAEIGTTVVYFVAYIFTTLFSKEFKNFKDLERHLHRIHQLSFCDICVKNLKLFPRERKCYTYRDLARHRRAGDPDDSSHKGHPRCEFCDERFMDDDQLFRHLRINHFMCHFCDADGYNQPCYPSVSGF